MKIYVFGYKGMLGRYVYTYLKSKDFNVVGLSRKNIDISDIYCEDDLNSILHYEGVEKNDVIINCAGIIKSVINDNDIQSIIIVNSLFPHYLNNVSKKEGYKLIHVTTDCVFSGKDGLYLEHSPHDCTDVYGKTKSLGEPNNCTVIRTSIIGEEINRTRSLMEWVKSMKDKTVDGYTNHIWNGLTCLQLAKIFEDIIVNKKYWYGVRHLFSPKIISKYDLIKSISNIYNLNITINPIELSLKCARSLSTNYPDTSFIIPDINDQIKEQHDFINLLNSEI